MADIDRLREEWNAAYAAFIGSFDTPIARRRDNSEFAQDARSRLSAFNETMQSMIETSGAEARLDDSVAYKKGFSVGSETVAQWHDQQAAICGEWRNWGGPSDPMMQQKEGFHLEAAKAIRETAKNA